MLQRLDFLNSFTETELPRSRLSTSKLFAITSTTILVLCAVFSVAPSVVAAQGSPSEITMQAEAAFDGHFKYGEWLPIFIDLENAGADIDGIVQVSVPFASGATVYDTPISLPSLSRKRIVLYVVPNNFSRQLEVEFVVGNERIADSIVSVVPLAPINYLVGLISPDRGALTLLKSVELPGQKRTILLLDTSLQAFPEKYEGLRSFDLLVLNNTDTSAMTPDQAFALETWVRRGGRLVIGGGPGAARTLAGLPETLVPLNPDDSIKVDELPGLEAFVGVEHPIQVPGPFLITSGDLQSSIILASQDNTPLIIEKTSGNGFVDFVTLDLSASPFDAWSGTISFWERMISPGSAYPEWLPQDISVRQQAAGQMPYALSNLPVLDLPSAQGLALLLSLYIVAVGPLNYLVLRWRRRLHWAWITIPVITVIFSAGAFGLGYALHGTDIFINKIAVLEISESGRAHVNNYLGVFSPSQQTYEIEVRGGGLVSPLEAYTDPWSSISPPGGSASVRDAHIVQGDPAFIRGLSVNQWSLQSFMVEGIQVEMGSIDADLLLQNDRLSGRLQNETSQLIQDATIIFGGQFYALGDIATGESVSIDMSLLETVELTFGPPISYRLMETQFNQQGSPGSYRQADVKRVIIESVIERGSQKTPLSSGMPILLGWLDQAPPDIRITGETPSQQTTALIYTALPYHLPDSGFVSLPAGLVPGYLSQMPPGGGPCGDISATAVYLNQGKARFEFRLPAAFRDIEIDNLKLNIFSDSPGPGFPNVSLQNWRTGEWTTYVPEIGANLITNAGDLVRGDGLIYIELSQAENNAFSGCYFLALGFEGWR